MLQPDRELYRKEYRGINIEVSRHWVNHPNPRTEVWCFYLLLAVEGFPEETRPGLIRDVVFTDYGTPMRPYAECLENLDWHCGMTFYEVTKNPGYPFTSIKAGCDYSHYWDEGQAYIADGVMRDAEKCVDSFLLLFPNYKNSETLWDEFREPYEAKRREKEAVGVQK